MDVCWELWPSPTGLPTYFQLHSQELTQIVVMCTCQRKSLQAGTQGQATGNAACTGAVRRRLTVETGTFTKESTSTACTAAAGALARSLREEAGTSSQELTSAASMEAVNSVDWRLSTIEAGTFTQVLTRCAAENERDDYESDGKADVTGNIGVY